MIATSAIFQSPSTQDPSTTFQVTASSPGAGNILNVTVTAAGIVPGQGISGALLPYGETILPYGTQGTTGTGGTGTYAMSVLCPNIPSETMTLTLSPAGQAGVGSLWYQTDTTLMFNRNTANTGWNLIGPVNIANFGLLPRAGGVVTEPITGSNGLMTSNGVIPFGGVPYVNSKNSLAATLSDLSESQSNLSQQISILVSQALSQSINIPSIDSNILIKFGTLGTLTTGPVAAPLLTIPIAGLAYGNGQQIVLSECHGFASVNSMYPTPSLIVSPQDGRGMTWYCTSGSLSSGSPGVMNYMLIAVKTGS